LMLKSAEWVSMFPGAVTYHPATAFPFLIAAALGGLWLCLWQNKWRWLGLVPVIIGTLGFLVTPRPDILIDDDGVTVAVRAPDGNLIVRSKNMDDFDVLVWKQRDGHMGINAPALLNWFDIADKGGFFSPLPSGGAGGGPIQATHSPVMPTPLSPPEG